MISIVGRPVCTFICTEKVLIPRPIIPPIHEQIVIRNCVLSHNNLIVWIRKTIYSCNIIEGFINFTIMRP